MLMLMQMQYNYGAKHQRCYNGGVGGATSARLERVRRMTKSESGSSEAKESGGWAGMGRLEAY
jgi:hypothetical protein